MDMKALRLIAMLLLLAGFAATPVLAQQKSKADTTRTATRKPAGFVDKNGDGFNDNAPDHDGDGIPNGLDPDFKRGKQGKGRGFVDANGDGINDRAPDHDGDGIPNGLDPDFRGPKTRNGGKGVVDQDGDGIPDKGGPQRKGRGAMMNGTPAGPGAATGDCGCSVPGSNGKGNGKGGRK